MKNIHIFDVNSIKELFLFILKYFITFYQNEKSFLYFQCQFKSTHFQFRITFQIYIPFIFIDNIADRIEKNAYGFITDEEP